MKETRQYGLFEKQDGRWIRLVPFMSAKKSVAVHIFQNLLLSGTLEGKDRALRPVIPKKVMHADLGDLNAGEVKSIIDDYFSESV